MTQHGIPITPLLWFGARWAGGILGAALGATAGSLVRYATTSPDGTLQETDLRYGLSGIGMVVGWIAVPLIAIALGSIVGRSRGHVVVIGVFVVAIGVGGWSAISLYRTLTEAGHPAAVPVFLMDVTSALLWALVEPVARSRGAKGLLFPSSYWPE